MKTNIKQGDKVLVTRRAQFLSGSADVGAIIKVEFVAAKVHRSEGSDQFIGGKQNGFPMTRHADLAWVTKLSK